MLRKETSICWMPIMCRALSYMPSNFILTVKQVQVSSVENEAHQG